MAYLSPDFQADAFVSYAHGDPRGDGDTPLKQWTLALIRRLEQEVRCVDPEFADVLLWRDEEHVDPLAHLKPALREKVTASGVFIIVMSRYYLASAWCGDELDWFAKQVRERALDNDRVFVVNAQPTEDAKWPAFLRGEGGHRLPGFRFHAAGAEIPYGWPDFVLNNEELRKEQTRLLTTLVKKLRDLKRQLPAPLALPAEAPLGFVSAPPAQIPPARATEVNRIYLHANPAALSARDEIKIVLKTEGLNAVAPTSNVASAANGDLGQAERRARLAMVKRCNALALVTADGGARDEEDFFQICVDERKEMEAAHGGPLPCIVLDRSGGRLSFAPNDWDAGYIDATRPDWRGEMRDWFRQALATGAGAAP